MRKSRCVKKWIKITAYLMTACILFSQSMMGMAAEDKPRMPEGNIRSSQEADEQEADGIEDKEGDENTEETVEKTIPTQIEDLETAQKDLHDITEQKSILALVYLCDKYGVKASPSIDSSAVVSVVSGQSVQIVGVDLDEEGNVWYKVSLYQNEKSYTGYIEEKYLATSDEVFLEWTDEYVEEDASDSQADKPMTMSLPIMTLSDYPDVDQFPASYQNALLALKQKYPNWIFVKMETSLDFNTAVSKELGDKSWISSSQPASWKNGATKQSGWSYASEGILRYYMDPRNFLTESCIFQFEQLTYNASYHTEGAVQVIVANSFMSGDIPNENMTYARAFTKIGEELKISPFHLASRVLQEQGTKGTSPLISGTYAGYVGYYNYFNVGASGSDIELIVKGLTEAKNRGWDTRYKSLYGGASVIGQNYILRGQDTLYLQKFNVSSNSTYEHQYMQNIMAPASEAPGIMKAYGNTGSLNNSFVFKIPVYSNMPTSACPKPDTTDEITLNKSSISNLAVDKTEKLIPYVNGSKVDSVKDMSFSSNNTGVATVDTQGVVKAVSPGTATITCARSGAASASCTVTVVKAEPIVDTPVLSPVVYKEGLKLSDISLPEGWSWSNGDTALAAGTSSYPAVYTPEDTTKYLSVTRQIGLKVSRAIPSCDVPKDLTAKLGSKLGSISLPSGFIWESDEEIILDKVGERTFYLSYIPGNQNYFELMHIPVVVRVIGEQTGHEESDNGDDSSPGGDNQGNAGGSNGSSGTGSGSDSAGSGSTDNSSGNSGSAGSESNSGVSSGTGSGNAGTTGSAGNGNSGGSGNSTNGGPSIDHSPKDDNPKKDGTTSNGSSNQEQNNGANGSSGAGNTENGVGTENSGNTQNTDSSVNNGNTNGSNGSNNTNSGGITSSDSDNRNGVSNKDNANSIGNGNSADAGGSQAGSQTPDNNAALNNSGSDNKSTAGSNNTTGNSNTANTNSGTAADNSSIANTNSGTAAGKSNAVNTNSNTAANNTDIADASNSARLSPNADLVTETAGVENTEEPVYERPSIMMDMEDVTILTEEMLQMAKEQNIDLLLMINNRAKWRVNTNAAIDAFSDIDMNVLFQNGVIPQELLEDTAGENEYLEFSLAHDGTLGFMAELEIALNPEDCGRYANLFYFDSEAEALDFICASIIDENGYARFSMEHASRYVIIISDYPMTGVINSNTEAGFKSWWILLGILTLAALAGAGYGVYYYWQKRQEDDEEEDEDDEEEYEDDLEEEIIELSAKEMKGLAIHDAETDAAQESADTENAEDDWIEDEDWQEPEEPKKDIYADDHAENDWIEDDEWDISNDWMEDDEWEKKRNTRKTAV